MSLYTFKWELYLNDEKKTVDPPLFYNILRGLKALCDKYGEIRHSIKMTGQKLRQNIAFLSYFL